MISLSCFFGAACFLTMIQVDPPPTFAEVETRFREVEKKAGPAERPRVDDIAVFMQAHNQLKDNAGKNVPTLRRAMLDEASRRLDYLGAGRFPWVDMEDGWSCLAYKSKIDGTLQPCAVYLPRGYRASKKPWPVDVVLHGRSDGMTHASFLAAHSFTKKPSLRDRVVLEVFGRGNVAYRWAGETDVFEAIDALWRRETGRGRQTLLDPDRMVLRGFSMGGAGAWHIGLHQPDRWVAVQPGAGFTTTIGYAKNLPDPLPAWQSRALNLYDARASAENACMVPIVAYSGADDPQMDAAKQIENALKTVKATPPLRFSHIVAPGLGHKMPAEWEKKVEETLAPFVAAGRKDPDQVKFVVHSLRHGRCFWVETLGLEQHYSAATIDAKRGGPQGQELDVTTRGVTALRMATAGAQPGTSINVQIDGQTVRARAKPDGKGKSCVELARLDGRWGDGPDAKRYLDSKRKKVGVQGPIDDAFMDRFVCVVGTGQSKNPIVHELALARLEAFRAAWREHFHGEVVVRTDADLLPRERADANLILFGDASSNAVIRDLSPRLPIRYVGDDFVMGTRRYNAASHLPVLIHPSPYNQKRYVVLNSGHTFGEAELKGTNALLFPRMGDWAILRAGVPGGELLEAGFFNEDWSWPQ